MTEKEDSEKKEDSDKKEDSPKKETPAKEGKRYDGGAIPTS